ncbi:MAG: ATP-binding protein [Myxococcales bacterium]
MQVFGNQLSAFPLQAIFDQAEVEISEAGVARVLAGYGTSRRELADPSAWVSLEFVEAVVADFLSLTHGDFTFLERAAMRSVSAPYMGPLYPLMVGLGSPSLVYRHLPRTSRHFDRLGRWYCDWAAPGSAKLTWVPDPGAPVAPFFCPFRQVQLSQVPLFFALPPARLAHPSCVFRGDSACVYELTWQEAQARHHAAWGALAGVGAAAAFAFAQHLPTGAAALLAGMLAAGGWGLGKAWALRHELSVRVRDIDAHNRALERMTQRNEERYSELLEAKNATERIVEERTHELRVTAQQLSQTLAQVQELDKAKTDFFSNVSHELRTPLTLVLGPLSELAEGRTPAGGIEQAVQIMHRNGMRLLELINQLLHLHQFDAGKVQLQRVPTDLIERTQTVQSRFATACAERGLEFITDFKDIGVMSLDPTWIESALTNLVANALRYAKHHIIVRGHSTASAVVLEVEDDGPGIEAEDLPRVFERFVRGSHQPGRQPGTGLGLAIVRETARLHGGDVSVRSSPGEATVFTLTLPRSLELQPAVSAVKPEPAASAPLLAPSLMLASVVSRRHNWPGPNPNAPLVALIEDDDEMREIIGNALSTVYRVRSAVNGREGLALIQDVRPDAVVSDVMMPELDGYELCRELRRRDDMRQVPVLLLTARGDVEHAMEGFEAGADDYVTKPFHPRELLARVGVQVRMRRMVSELAHRERLVALGVLAASMAHQIRSPLTSISAGLPLLERRLGNALDGKNRDLLRSIMESGERIEQQIADLLSLSRVDQESQSRFRPAEGVESVVRLLRARSRSGVTIEVDIQDSALLHGKPSDIGHVFLNLIDNAVRAAEPSGRVKVRTYDADEQFVFEVGDSGGGIPKDKEEAVFSLFFTTRAEGEGTGLGLPIARQVVLQHGGSIHVGQSELGGAQFTVSLPIARVSTPPPAPADMN